MVDASASIFNLTAFVDADLADRFGADDPSDSSSVRSRSGFVIKLGSCPLLWKSQLQSLTAIRCIESMHAGYHTSPGTP